MSYALLANDVALTVFDIGQPQHRRSPNTTNLDRILSDLLHDVLQGYLTSAEADAAYGRQTGVGRKRRFPRFADYVTDRIRYAEDRAVEQHLRDLLAQSVRPARNALARSIETREINRLLEETGRARADRLRELLAELTGETIN